MASKKCSKCKQTFEEEELIKVGKKLYCEKDYNEYYVPEVNDWNDLYEYIKKYNYLDRLPTSAIVLLKKYHSEEPYQFDYFLMLKTYEYMIIHGVDFSKSEGNLGIGLIPYYIDKAITFFSLVFNLEEVENTEKKEPRNIVTLKNRETNKQKHLIGANEIWGEEYE